VKRRHILILGIVAIGAPLLALWSTQEAPSDGTKEPEGTQVVLQWLDNGPMNSSTRVEPMLDLLNGLSNNLYVVDSFDLGGGTTNVFLYSADPDGAARRVIELFDDGLLPQGMRIGIANSNGDQSTRTYRPFYPADLTEFQIIYPSENALKNRGGE
jgi:hypothetical protein